MNVRSLIISTPPLVGYLCLYPLLHPLASPYSRLILSTPDSQLIEPSSITNQTPSPPDYSIRMDAPLRLPLIDLSELDGPKHDQVVEALVKATETFGFFQVVNHGLSVEFLEELKDSVHRFHNQSQEKKEVYLKEASPSPLVNFSFSSMGPSSWNFLFMKYTNEKDAFQYWPDSCKEVALKYVETSSKLVEKVLRILMCNLGATLDQSMVDEYTGVKHLLMNHYPTCPDQVITNPGYAYKHTKHIDSSTLSVLLQDHIGGLFCKLREEGDMENNYKGEWVEVKPIPGALIVMVGDCLQVLSNGKYKGVEHYVQTFAGREARVSFPIFMFPRLTRKIQPMPQVAEKDGVTPQYIEFLFGKNKEYEYSLCREASSLFSL